MADIILSSVGTRGDLLPAVELASTLSANGHEVQLLATEEASPLAEQRGIAFHPIAPTYHTNLAPADSNFEKYIFPSYERTFSYFERQVAPERRPLIVNLSPFSATNIVAERRGFPVCRLVLAPYSVASLRQPPQPWGRQLEEAQGDTQERRQVLRRYLSGFTDSYLLGRMNQFRSTFELEPITNLLEMNLVVREYVGLFPAWFAPSALDWPSNLQAVGFPLPNTGAVLPCEAQHFLREFGAPLVFVPGTGALVDSAYCGEAVECCIQLGLSGIVLGLPSSLRGRLSEKVMGMGFVEHQSIFSRASLVVHHGGIGTSARALEAGVPQLVRPRAFDQPDNAYRLRQLGVAEVVPHMSCSSRSLATTAADVLETRSYLESARRLSRLVRQSTGIAKAMSVIERLADSQHSTRSAGSPP